MVPVRPSRDQWALGLARLTAGRSTCLRRAVGCVLLDARGHVIATGYNGVASGQRHCNEIVFGPSRCEGKGNNREVVAPITHPYACAGAQAPSGTNLDGCQAIHAEQNALLQCRDVYAIDACFVTTSPCVTCVKLLLNTGCQRIVYEQLYPQPEARALWERAGRIWDTTMEVR